MNYTAERQTVDGLDVVSLTDAAARTTVRIAPALGNNSYEMTVNGQNIFWTPPGSLGAWKAKPAMLGNPFLAPWANRLDQEGFWANGNFYKLNPKLDNYKSDGFRQPIHGLVVYAPHWQVASLEGGGEHAAVVSRLEFWRHPGWMAQFPFAHNIEMIYRLKDGVLEVETVLENLSVDPMPVSIGYHPYFTLPGVPRDSWQVRIPAREHVELSAGLTPTGARKPLDIPNPLPLAGKSLDDVYAGVDPAAEFSVEGGGRKIALRYGPKYPVAVVYAPPGRDFICFEPMSGITNAFNLAHEGKYRELQEIAPGGRWRESFWIRPSGF